MPLDGGGDLAVGEAALDGDDGAGHERGQALDRGCLDEGVAIRDDGERGDGAGAQKRAGAGPHDVAGEPAQRRLRYLLQGSVHRGREVKRDRALREAVTV
jgi:hypothetical protein